MPSPLQTKKTGQEKLLILDLSSLVYRAYYALPEFTAAEGRPAGAVYGLIAILLKLLAERRPTHVLAALDLPGETFRHRAYQAYKATRLETPENLVLQFTACREAVEAYGIPVVGVKGYEADDVIAAAVAWARKEIPGAKIEIVSGDADVFQLVDDRISVITPKRGITDVVVLTPQGVEEKLGIPPKLVTAYKALRGDSSDNIPGVSGIGPKTAAKLLNETGSLEELLRSAKHLPKGASSELRRFADALVQHENEIREREKFVTLSQNISAPFSLDAARLSMSPPPPFTVFLKRFGFESFIRRISPQRDKKGKSSVLSEEERKGFIFEQEKETLREIGEREKEGTFSFQIAELERLLVPIISGMEQRGIGVDKKELERLRIQLRGKQEILAKEIYALTGKQWNLASPKQLGEVLFDGLGVVSRRKTAKGKPSTAAHVLEELQDAHPVVGKLLRWREVTKLLTTYVETLPALIDPLDGRIHAKFWQLGTATGRIASSDPNLQNIPLRTEEGREVRNAFCAKKGHEFLAADYSQIELRVAAILSEDKHMLEIFQRGEDIHTATAQKVFHVLSESVTPEMRRRAKILNFGILYGMGPRRVGREMEVPFEEAQRFLDEYLAAYPKLSLWTKEVVERARQDGFTITAFGRKRPFPELRSFNHAIRSSAERAAINAPIQGTATGDLIKRGMVAVANLKSSSLALLVQVHDELLCEVVSEEFSEKAGEVRQALEGVWPESPIPLPVRITRGTRWGSMAPF